MRLSLVLILGVAACVGAHEWRVTQMENDAEAVRLAVRSLQLSHTGRIDVAMLTIEEALTLSPKNPSLWYDAGGIYAMKALMTYTSGMNNHKHWVAKSTRAAAEADRLSDDWFYTLDHADTLLFAHMYECEVDLVRLRELYLSIEDTRNAAVQQMIVARVKAVSNFIDDENQFFKPKQEQLF